MRESWSGTFIVRKQGNNLKYSIAENFYDLSGYCPLPDKISKQTINECFFSYTGMRLVWNMEEDSKEGDEPKKDGEEVKDSHGLEQMLYFFEPINVVVSAKKTKPPTLSVTISPPRKELEGEEEQATP